MRIDIITVLPELLEGFVRESILGRAQKKGLVEIHLHNLRDYATNKYRRVDDYQQLYHAAVKHTELGPEGVYRYYSTQRPVDIGTYPKPPDNQPLSIVNYDDDRRRPVADGRLMAWGELTYAKPLTEKQMEDYELKPAPGNPDRVRPSITARLKEGTRGQEPPKEPGQKRNHKNHEER